MQTTLHAFTGPSRRTETLPIKDPTNPTKGSLKRHREDDYVVSYPLPGRASKALISQLRYLRPHLYRGLFAQTKYGIRPHSWSALPPDASPVIRTVVPSIHPTRSTYDGEPLVSPLETFRNCISSTTWDPRDEYLVASQRSGFKLFGALSWLTPGDVPREASKPVLELKSATVQARLGGENRISFGLSVTQFLGSTLNTICGYSGAPQIDIFDLEDLDEATGEPLRTYSVRALIFGNSSQLLSGVSTTTAVVTMSDSVAVAALSNGCSALVDVRTENLLVCTETPPPPAILSASSSGTRRVSQGTAITAVEVADRSNGLQLLTGSKDGMLVLWDLRKRNEPVTISSVGGEIEALHVVQPSSSSRCGAPMVWLNTDSGDICCFLIGASSFEEVTRVSTSDSRRTQLSANLSPPKLAVLPFLNRLMYPHISSNSLLFYDIGCPISATEDYSTASIERSSITGTGKKTQTAFLGDFTDARSLLSESESNDDCAPVPADSKKCPKSLPLLFSCPFTDWSYQICSVSASNKHNAICIGGDDGDLHLLSDCAS
ncbi:hypothetical protein JKF63_00814 [Porcisia hertigi]|uniref:Uncharacterized protein n=1 Tax=Porcisia hertigi TaxID=2761500 RepID=A0A836GYZ7_9TRYP|nr:hypothetical protein JKF63_00814 [Porcisia hertigi]